METHSFFCQLLKQLPQTFFELLGLPPQRGRAYRFDSVEVKKSLRIDGVFLPKKAHLPLYFVEVQFQKVPTFYANLFAKVFCYLEENDPAQEWLAAAIFPSQNTEPEQLGPYEDLLNSQRVKRIYLDSHPMPADPPMGLSILQLLSAPSGETRPLVARLIHKVEAEIADSNVRDKIVELVEELLIRRFSQLTREEIRKMFQLHDLRKTRVWQEAHEEGVEKGIEKGIEKGREEGIEKGQKLVHKKVIRKLLDSGMPVKEIAALLELSIQEVRRLAKENAE